MSNVYVRSYQAATANPDAYQQWQQNLFGDNLGNLLYTYAVERQLSSSGNVVQPGPTRGQRLDPGWYHEHVDHLVIPLANAFRWTFRERLDTLSELIERLRIPVTVIGVGAQASAAGEWNADHATQIDASVKRFVGALLERGPSIGVRGEFTSDYLIGLGFPTDTVDIIGCPSMFLRGGDLTLRPLPDLTDDSPIALNLSPYVSEMGPIIEHNLARYDRLDYVAQDLQTLGLLLGEPYDGKGAGDPLLPTGPEHPLVAGGRAWMALNATTWLRELARYDFSFGTRIHGNIAALLAGTPAYVLAHDSRTLELARYHQIPHLVVRSLGDPALADAATLAAGADYGPTVSGHAERFERYVAYLDRHGLDHIFAPGQTGASFDDAVAAVDFHPAVRAGVPVPRLGRPGRPSQRPSLASRIAARLRR
ncbi:polysaccharide pyruvyl transferase family protein [Nocardioides sp. BP30]|uniref:polysaccharide pyruvyl transferase family protein n=1 Tax=Nocardioides sp. BP30 TaxID=3036374 RepID=UPI002469A9C6|nr:polysaccharide pyruvyl transferase family protein [Nocardioides sp. BP30]WGL50827.1 polysaccharide pyruvyl transferase family protein [Nocardioides sp. BP30]